MEACNYIILTNRGPEVASQVIHPQLRVSFQCLPVPPSSYECAQTSCAQLAACPLQAPYGCRLVPTGERGASQTSSLPPQGPEGEYETPELSLPVGVAK